MNLDLTELLAEVPAPVPPFSPSQSHLRLASGQHGADGALDWCLQTFSSGPFPPSGGRNDWVATFALFCNESGVLLSDLLGYCLAHYTAPDFDEDEIETTIRGIYAREAANYGAKPYTAVYRPQVALAPNMPADLYDELPDYLRRCCAPFEGHERAVMLLATLGVLSGCFPGVGGTYDQREHGLNLFLFILAQAASGKGSAAWAQFLARPWHKRLTTASALAQADYEAEVAAQKATHSGKGSSPYTPPPAPARRMLFIPGNTSAAAMLGQIAENDGRGIIFETEADTLSGALGAEHGKFGDVLRKVFHHEPVSVLRKADRQHIDIENPALSLALTGTPAQLARLIPSAEDGLASRFLFYSFSQPAVWRDVSPRAGKPLSSHFAPLADELTRMIEAAPQPTQDCPYPVQITLSYNDWDKINEAGAAGLVQALNEAGAAGVGTARRLGLIAWRVAGILTILRCFENGEVPSGPVEADPRDVTTAVRIMDTARAHALHVLATLPASPGGRAYKPNRLEENAEKAAQIRGLRAQGISWREIETQTNVPQATARRWAA
jgi:hypothetical protein